MYLVAHFQYMENYSFDADGCPVEGGHFKYKGGDSIVLRQMDVQEVMTAIEAGGLDAVVERIVTEQELCWDNVASRNYLLDWELVEEDSVHIVWDDPNDFSASDMEVQRIMWERDDLDYQGRWVQLDGDTRKKGWYFSRKAAA